MKSSARWPHQAIAGTHLGPWQDLQPTSRTMSIDEVYFFRVTNDRLSRVWRLEDTWTRHQQLQGTPTQPRRTRLTRRARRRLTSSVKIAVTVVFSIVAHGVTARPLTTGYVEDLDDTPHRSVT